MAYTAVDNIDNKINSSLISRRNHMLCVLMRSASKSALNECFAEKYDNSHYENMPIQIY